MESQGINKQVIFKKETGGWGTKASASSANVLRRVTGSFQLEKDVYNSNEINTAQQMSDMRHGTRRSTGSLSGEVAGNSYSQFIAAAVRKDFAAGVTTGTVTTISVTEAAGVSTFTRSAGSYITDGFKVGDVVESTGFVAGANNGLFVIVALTATVMTVEHFDEGGTLTVAAAGASVSVAVSGKKTLVPITAHTDDSFTVEEWYPDSSISRTFLGLQVDTMSVNVAPNNMATIEFGFLGKNAEAATGSQYFTSPTAQTTTPVYSGVNGLLIINGVASRKVTSLTLNLSNNIQHEGVIGSNVVGAKSRGKVEVSISGSAIFDDSSILGYFDNETEISVTYALLSADGTDAFSLTMPRVKIGSGTTDDAEKVIILSFDGVALLDNSGSTVKDLTTLSIIDTAA
jgi:hypothetical protein